MSSDAIENSINVFVSRDAPKCSDKCHYQFDYAISDLSVTNKGNYILLSYDNGNSTVEYNDSKYSVKEVRLYVPYVNDYYNKEIVAELFIHHTNNTDNFIVCIPIKSSDESSISKTMFDDIVPFIPSEQNEITPINIHNYTLNNFVPRNSYSVTEGKIPYLKNSSKSTILIFSSDKIPNMSKECYSILKNIMRIEDVGDIINSYKTQQVSQLIENKDGTKFNGQEQDGSDDIYIDCQPVDGEQSEINDHKDNQSMSYSTGLDNIKKYEWILVAGPLFIVGILVAYTLIKLFVPNMSSILPSLSIRRSTAPSSVEMVPMNSS
jgi:hypothetical protein